MRLVLVNYLLGETNKGNTRGDLRGYFDRFGA